MTDFQRKLYRFVGKMAVMAVAHDVGVDPSTLQRWLGGQAPTLNGLKTLAKGSGVPVAYWADENIAELPTEALERGTAPAGMARVRLGPSAVFEPDAKDPRALVMPDDSMVPVIERGQVVIYDAAAQARAGGELVVTRVGGGLGKGLTVRRRVALGKGWIYLAADGSCPAIAPSSRKSVEHPVVAVIMKPRRASSAARVVHRDEALRVAEEDPLYNS